MDRFPQAEVELGNRLDLAKMAARRENRKLKPALRTFSLARYLRILAAGTALLLLAGCRSTPPSQSLSKLTPTEMSGYAVFQSNCAVCHYANKKKALRGPGLQGLFKKRYLPSGVPITDDRVRETIFNGRAVMPAFGNVLDDRQINDLLAYLHTL